jgi:hypothetical protein
VRHDAGNAISRWINPDDVVHPRARDKTRDLLNGRTVRVLEDATIPALDEGNECIREERRFPYAGLPHHPRVGFNVDREFAVG